VTSAGFAPHSRAGNVIHIMRLDAMFGPFRARVLSFFGPPGRCPGLVCDCPFGAKCSAYKPRHLDTQRELLS
jgi:hypothetical protein